MRDRGEGERVRERNRGRQDEFIFRKDEVCFFGKRLPATSLQAADMLFACAA